ncbi:MAG: hypothetical protein M1839_006124 [Geoglossum umbratile]|nr:MAG: hypothetical protein M1839_006124 [Geoglossum umbratile]
MDDVLRKLRGVARFDDIIYYSLGLQSLVNTLAETQAVIDCTALCSCLADMHSEAMAARILAALWRAESFPEGYVPSHSQFLRLVRTCSGVVLGTTFGQTVDIILGDLRRYRNGGNFKSHITAAAVEGIDEALRGLFKLSTGTIDRISIIGGAEGVFIAAVATWLFDFPTYVQDGHGTLLFASAPNEDAAQVVVQYGELEQHSKAVLESTTHVLHPHDKHEIFAETADLRMLNLVIRTSWDGCLLRGFEALYRELVDIQQHLAKFLGSVARINAAFALR